MDTQGYIMGKLLGLIAILGAIYFGMQYHDKGGEGMLGGAFDPIETTERDSSAFGGHLIGGDVTMPTERDRSHTTQKVRDKLARTKGLGR